MLARDGTFLPVCREEDDNDDELGFWLAVCVCLVCCGCWQLLRGLCDLSENKSRDLVFGVCECVCVVECDECARHRDASTITTTQVRHCARAREQCESLGMIELYIIASKRRQRQQHDGVY